MYTNFPLYPTEIFNTTDYPVQTDNTDTVYADLINALRAEMQAVFNELGTLPKGDSVSVAARLTAIEADLPEKLSNPIAQWKMNDNAATTNVIESIGTIGDGTAQQNTDQLDTTGKINGALTFNGSTDYIDTNEKTAFNFGAGDFSVALWVYVDVWENDYPFISNALFTGHWDGFYIRGILGENFGATIVDVQINGNNGGRVVNTWYHVAVTRISGTVYIYVNGALDNSGVAAGNITVDRNLLIGRNPDTTYPRHFDGKLDDVRIYDFGLVLDDVQALYKYGLGTEKENPFIF